MREWREDVRLGIINECSPWSLVAGLSDCLSRVRGRTKEGPIVVDAGLSERLKRVNARQPLDNGSCYAVNCVSYEDVLSAASKTMLMKRQCVLGGCLVREIAVACSWRERGICRYTKPRTAKTPGKIWFQRRKRKLSLPKQQLYQSAVKWKEMGKEGWSGKRENLSREEHVR